MRTVIVYLALFSLHLGATTWFYVSNTTNTPQNYLYNATLSLFLVLAIVQSVRYYSLYRALRPILAPLIVSNILFTLGSYIWLYYRLTGTAGDYANFTALFFLLYYPANTLALYQISRVTKILWGLGTSIMCLFLTLLLATISIAFLSSQTIDFTAPLPLLILQLIYPLLDAILVAVGLTTLRNQKSMGYRYLFLYVFGYLTVGLADTIYAYQASLDIAWSGSIIDLLYALSYTLIGLGTHYLPTLTGTTQAASSDTVPSAPPATPSPAVPQPPPDMSTAKPSPHPPTKQRVVALPPV